MAKVSDARLEAGRMFKLGDRRRSGTRSSFSAPVLIGFNMGNRTLSMTIPMEQFREHSEIANEARIIEAGGALGDVPAQRPLDEKHARAIAVYMLRGLLASVKSQWIAAGREITDKFEDILLEIGEGPYQGLQPFTGNIRACSPGGDDLDLVEAPEGSGRELLLLRQGQVIFIIDGQHRRHAYGMMIGWLRDILATGRYTTKKKGGFYVPEATGHLELSPCELEIWSSAFGEARSHLTVDITVHLGLTIEQEKQLFHDLNNLGKKPDPALSQAFDQANPISIFIRRVVEGENLLGHNLRIADAGSKKGGKKKGDTNTSDDGTIYRDDLVSSNAMLFAGATNQAGIYSPVVTPHYDYGRRFWKAVASQPHFGEPGWSRTTLLAQPVMIKALAQLAYTFHGSARERDPAILETFMEALEAKRIDFSPENPLWRTYLIPESDRNAAHPELADYLTPTAYIGSYATWEENSRMLRFAPNSRDIARYLGDLIRWNLSIQPRPGISALKAKLAKVQSASQGTEHAPTSIQVAAA